MDKPDLLLDLDGVARNFIAGTLPLVKNITGRDHHHDDVDQWRVENALKLTPEQAKEMYTLVAQEGWCRSLPPYDGSKEGIAQLREVVNIYPVTFQFPSLWWVRECEEWLVEHYSIDPNDVVHTNAKHITFGDYFVEDKTATLVKWRAYWRKRGLEGKGIKFVRKYNVADEWNGLVVHSWPELVSTIISDLASSQR